MTVFPRARGARAVPTTLLALLALAPILIAATVVLLFVLNRSFQLHDEILRALQENDQVVALQLDLETGIRGYAATGRDILLEPYFQAKPKFAPALDSLENDVATIGVAGGERYIGAIRANNREWLRRVATPTLVELSGRTAQLEVIGKVLVDRFRVASFQLGRALQRRAIEADRFTRNAILELAAAVVLFSILAMLIVASASRHRRALVARLDAERGIIDVLQSALANRLRPVAGLNVGTVYLSATDGVAVGGDFLDVQPLGQGRGYVLVGDVSGKGINAAVDTALIRNALRGLLLTLDDPGLALSRFNALFAEARSNQETFVVMFLGIVDLGAMTLRYASAGLSTAFLRRGSDVRWLAVTGPLLGVFPEIEIESANLDLQTGDVLVVATDGLSEARNARNEMVEDEGARRWVQEANSAAPQDLVDAIVARLKEYAREIRDDLAIVAAQIGEPPSS